MKNKKFNLTSLKITSFITNMDEEKNGIKGGATLGDGCSQIGCTISYKPFCKPTSPSLCTCNWNECQHTKTMCIASAYCD